MLRLPLRLPRMSRVLVASAIVVLLAGPSVSAIDVILVEEQWELHVGGPDAARSAPQVSMLMSPTSDVDDDFFIFTLNHSSYPEFVAGGMQIQRWWNGDCLATVQGSGSGALQQEEEVIRWVQRIRMGDGNLRFEILNGASETWGSFGSSGELAVTIPTALTRLNKYRPAISIEQSGISYAGNRVSSLVLKRLKWQTIDGEFHEQVAPIDIATQLDP